MGGGVVGVIACIEYPVVIDNGKFYIWATIMISPGTGDYTQDP
jgi:hypothetical protein